MPHIHTNDSEHDLTVTAYIIRTDTPEPQALLHMHRKLNRLLPVGGHVEINESPWQAIAHELEEESGYTLNNLEILQPLSRIKHMTSVVQHPYPLSMNTHDIPDAHFHTDIEYAFIAKSDPDGIISEGESIDLRWLTHEEMNELDSSVIFTNTKEVYDFIFDEALQNWERVSTNDFLLNFPKNYISSDY